MRRLLTLLLCAVFVLSGSGTTLAGPTFPDLDGSAAQRDIISLHALGIIGGYPDGTFRPENPITRAEFAAVIARAMGLEAAAMLMTGPTKFADVTTDHAWAYGYINTVSAMGIIKGDPDGRFRPGDEVSYAEAATMLLRAGGWDAACATMDWPAGFVMKAVELGLTKNVAFAANLAADRGAVAAMTYNALAMPMAEWNDLAKAYRNAEDTLASRYLRATEKTVIITAVPMTDSALTAAQVMTAEDGPMSVPTGVNANTLLGREVRVIKVGGAYVHVADVTPLSYVLSGVAFVGAGTSSLTYTDGQRLFTRDIATGAAFVMNSRAISWAGLTADILDGDGLTLFLNANGEIRFVIARYWDHAQQLVAATHVAGADGQSTNRFVLDCGCDYRVLANTVFTRNGLAATYADMAIGDIAYIQSADGSTATAVELYGTTIIGMVTAISLNLKGEAVLTVNGTDCVVDNLGFASRYVTLDGARLAKNSLGALINHDVVLRLDVTGKALVVTGMSTPLIGVVAATPAPGVTDRISVAVRGVVNEYGTTVNTSALVKDDRVALKQRADGKITALEKIGLSAVHTVRAIDTVNRKITLADGSTPAVLSVVQYADSAFGVRIGTWGGVDLLKVGDAIQYWATGPSPIIKYFEVTPNFAGHVYGKYIGMTSSAGKHYAFIDVLGEVKSFETTDTSPSGTFVVVALNSAGVATAIAPIVPEGVPEYEYQVNAFSGPIFTVTRSGDSIVAVHDLSSAIVYRADGSLGTLDDLQMGTRYKRVLAETITTMILLCDAQK